MKGSVTLVVLLVDKERSILDKFQKGLHIPFAFAMSCSKKIMQGIQSLIIPCRDVSSHFIQNGSRSGLGVFYQADAINRAYRGIGRLAACLLRLLVAFS
jgi:hypothetical protein